MEAFNPWWRREPDNVVQEWEEAPVRWFPEEILNTSLEPFSLNFVFGPRQVGKTTAIKLLIQKLLEKRESGSIFYYSCDELTDYEELGEILDTYLNSVIARYARQRMIFLDEVTFVEDWWRALKARIDSGKLKHDVVTVTGSASLELLQEKERFPGRRGNGKDVVMYPRTFQQYAEILSGKELAKASSLDQIMSAMRKNAIYIESLSLLLESYLKSGGFPRAIIDTKERGKVSDATIRSLLDSVRSDWSKAGRNDRYMKELLGYILQARGTPISWLSISRETSLSSPHTAQVYVETLEKLLLAVVLEFISPYGKVIRRKNRKIHFSDPLVYHAFSVFSRVSIDEPAMVEGIVASHLSRKYDVYYWKNASEVDAVVKHDKKITGIETKWGFGRSQKPRHLSNYILLEKEKIPLFLASFSI